MELFCNLRVDLLPGEAERYARELARLAPMEVDGICVVSADHIEVSELGRHFIRNVCAVFDAYLEGDAERRYSATAWRRSGRCPIHLGALRRPAGPRQSRGSRGEDAA